MEKHEIESHIGKTFLSDWKQITQEHLDKMMEASEGFQWIHNDPEKAKTEAPFGNTIAQGHLLLSNNVDLAYQVLSPLYDQSYYQLNYGYDKVRLINPVVVNSHIRARFTILSVEKKEADRLLMKVQVEQEIKETGKLSLVAEWLFMLLKK